MIVFKIIFSFANIEDSSVSIEYDKNAPKVKKKRRAPSLIVGPSVACLTNNEASLSGKPTVMIEDSQRFTRQIITRTAG